MSKCHCPICKSDVIPDQWGDCPGCGLDFASVQEPSVNIAEPGNGMELPAPVVLAEKRLGRLTGASWTVNATVRLGRGDSGSRVDIDLSAFPDHAVSRQHATLSAVNGAWQLRDLGSSCGTFLNGERLESESRAVQPGDTLGFGGLLFLVQSTRKQE